MSIRKAFLVVLAIGVVIMVSGCEDSPTVYTNEIDGEWVDVDTEWTDSDFSQLSYVDDGTDIWIDLGWYTDAPTTHSDWIMGFIKKFNYNDGVLTGKYTSYQNADSNEEFNITITFSYADPTLTAVVVADGVLGNKTLILEPVED
ncbi:MAG: hypothetical protein WBI82_08240 [Sphaerochaeta sp.]